MERLLAFPVRTPEQPGLEIRVNFGMFAGREATAAEIQELGAALLPEIGSAEISAETRFEIGPESEADVHQVRIEVPQAALPANDFQVGELAGRLVAIAERWAQGCIDERRVELGTGEPLVPPWTASSDTRTEAHERSGESAVSPPRADGS